MANTLKLHRWRAVGFIDWLGETGGHSAGGHRRKKQTVAPPVKHELCKQQRGQEFNRSILLYTGLVNANTRVAMRTNASGFKKKVCRKLPINARGLALVALMLLVLAGVAASAKADSLDGVWKAQFGTFTLKRNGDQVTGTHVDPRGHSWEISGVMLHDGSGRTRFSWNEFGGGAVVVYDAIINGDTMSLMRHIRSGDVQTHVEDKAHRLSH